MDLKNTLNKNSNLIYCPYCGSTHIEESKGGQISFNKSREIKVGFSKFFKGEIKKDSENLSTSIFETKYVCLDCGYQFNEGNFLEIYESLFKFNEVALEKYFIITGKSNLKNFDEALKNARNIKNGKLFRIELEKSMKIRVKEKPFKFEILIKKTKEDYKVIFIIEKINKVGD